MLICQLLNFYNSMFGVMKFTMKFRFEIKTNCFVLKTCLLVKIWNMLMILRTIIGYSLKFFSNILSQKNNLRIFYTCSTKRIFLNKKNQLNILSLANHTTVTHKLQFLFHGKIFLAITNLKCLDTISRKYREFNMEGQEWIKNII